MKKQLLSCVLSIFLPAICTADGSPDPSVVQVSYGFSNLTFNSGPVQEVKIDHSAGIKTGGSLSLVGVAEAAVAPDTFEGLSNAVNEARQLDDLKPILTESAFQSLQAKVKPGVSQYTVLAMFQAMRPQKARIVDSNIQGDKAQLSMAGNSSFGPVNGLVRLVKVNGDWKIESENWFAGGKDRADPVDTAFVKPINVLSSVSPEYAINRNVLSLYRVPTSRRNRAITFVFLMNEHKKKPAQEGNLRQHIHIMVPKAKKWLLEQKTYDHECPIDVSVAKYEDGYSADEWNVVLPGKKPREVIVSLLWSF